MKFWIRHCLIIVMRSEEIVWYLGQHPHLNTTRVFVYIWKQHLVPECNKEISTSRKTEFPSNYFISSWIKRKEKCLSWNMNNLVKYAYFLQTVNCAHYNVQFSWSWQSYATDFFRSRYNIFGLGKQLNFFVVWSGPFCKFNATHD